MKFISFNYSGLTYFNTANPTSQFSGSSKYKMIGGELYKPNSQPYESGSDGDKLGKNKIENNCAIVDYLQNLLSDNLTFEMQMKIKERLFELGYDNIGNKYLTTVREKKSVKKLNKSKLKGKMAALFNLKSSRKFIAFFSVSFPLEISDDVAFECWNAWLTSLRKRFGLTNYVWVIERQSNGTIHYHMLSNNRMPIKSINKSMAVIINNKVEKGEISWGKSSLELYNGVDVDSIYNSKRHKETGAYLKPEQIRAWIQKYLTKYVTKNNESFTHLCWHCSHSISQLFTSMILDVREGFEIIRKLPEDEKMYAIIKGDFFEHHAFLFVPPPWLFISLQQINDYLFNGFEPKSIYKNKLITIKKTKK